MACMHMPTSDMLNQSEASTMLCVTYLHLCPNNAVCMHWQQGAQRRDLRCSSAGVPRLTTLQEVMALVGCRPPCKPLQCLRPPRLHSAQLRCRAAAAAGASVPSRRALTRRLKVGPQAPAAAHGAARAPRLHAVLPSALPEARAPRRSLARWAAARSRAARGLAVLPPDASYGPS